MRAVLALGVVALTGACTVAGPRPGGGPEGGPAPGAPVDGAEPGVRIGVAVDVPSLEVSGTAGFEVVDADGRVRSAGGAGETREATRAGGGVALTGGGETIRAGGPLTVRPRGGGEVVVDGTRYRGAVLLLPAVEGVTAVNLLDMETYLLGVVPLEIGAGRPPEEVEAVKAQAIAARTYAVRHMGRRSSLGFDLYGTTADQVYGGADAEDAVAARAVRETRGEVLMYGGEPIEAFYHSTCGGRTAALEEVWDGAPRPYLRSVSDARPSGGFYCEASSRFRWSEHWTGPELEATLERELATHTGDDVEIGTIRSLEVTGHTPSGRVEALRIRTDAGDFRIPADSIRWVLRPEPSRGLNSTYFDLHPEGADEVTALTVDGGGWGHGIGMCQVGAMGRARDGQSYREILSAYYPGATIARLYP